MKRRDFLNATTIHFASFAAIRSEAQAPVDSAKFQMAFAPHFGMFEASAGADLIDQLRFASDRGFTAWEDNSMKYRSPADQQQIAAEMERLGMRMGVISAMRGLWKKVSFAGNDRATREEVLDLIKEASEVARRVHATYLTVVVGFADPKLSRDYQTANCIDLLKRCCDIVEPHQQVMVLEPLNTKKNHPGVFLSESPHAFQICKAVSRPSCKILFDIYHQQITEGNLIPNIDRCWDEIAYFQAADNPGRKEPGTGEIHYKNVFAHIAAKGYDGVVGMEHGNSINGKEGERAVIEAYRAVDPT